MRKITMHEQLHGEAPWGGGIRQERTGKWSEFKEAIDAVQIGSLERDKESHVTHIKGSMKVKSEKVKVEAGHPFLFPFLSQQH